MRGVKENTSMRLNCDVYLYSHCNTVKYGLLCISSRKNSILDPGSQLIHRPGTGTRFLVFFLISECEELPQIFQVCPWCTEGLYNIPTYTCTPCTHQGHIHSHMFMHTKKYFHAHSHTFAHVHAYTITCACVHWHICTHMCAHKHPCTYMYSCANIKTWVCAHVSRYNYSTMHFRNFINPKFSDSLLPSFSIFIKPNLLLYWAWGVATSLHQPLIIT